MKVRVSDGVRVCHGDNGYHDSGNGGEELSRNLLAAAEQPSDRIDMALDRIIEGFHRKGEANEEHDHAERNDSIMRPHPVDRAAQPSGDASP
jgi:hypothetical protein